MTDIELQTFLQKAFPDTTFSIGGDGHHVDITAIGSMFEGLRTLKRQQLIYTALEPLIRDGSVHAVNFKLLTPQEKEEGKDHG
jgi:acid stress-induced BolA-like protein IbaG/YrbA